ncbi:hypothetical protein QTI66_27610 [Variovorax sp. J22R133]|uniref:hypothetical protein n=1 Tax=Variovorax brevis TaxID=3053503 RepID=UPI00257598A8|nr:hypothetical protein [Variovorax sp. J22R133]MDM0115947.1 hypothetical protein [Variovorax sp. J22R133]
MFSLRQRSRAPRHFAWLLWLAMLLPIAQAASATHALSHTGDDLAAAAKHKQLQHLVHCEICVAAGAIGGGALPSPPLSLPPLLAARHEAPQADADGVWQGLPLLAYQGRAPPVALH